MMRVFVAIAVLCFLIKPASAEPLSFDLAQHKVEITSGFSGTSLIVFGSRAQRGEVAIIVEGPEQDIMVRRKSEVLGAWINTKWMRFEKLPSYYDYALNIPEVGAIPLAKDLQREKHLGLEALKTEPSEGGHDAETVKIFQNALLRRQQMARVYPVEATDIQYISENLFRADFWMPANLPSGKYTVRALLIDGGGVVYEQQKAFEVGLTGFNAATYRFSKDYGVLYGLMCVAFACFAGWLSNVIVRRG